MLKNPFSTDFRLKSGTKHAGLGAFQARLIKLLGSYPTGTRSTERIEDEIPLPAGGKEGATNETQGLLGGMVAVAFLPPWHGRDAPDGGELGFRVPAVYELVVEGVAGAVSFSRPKERLVGVGLRKLGQRRA